MVRDSELGYEPDDSPFRVVMFGYERDAVDAHLDDLTEHARSLARENRRLTSVIEDAEEIRSELGRAQDEIKRLREVAMSGGPALAGGARIAELMRHAEQVALGYRAEAQQIISEAESEAEKLRRQAREDASLAALAWREEAKNETVKKADPPKKHLVTSPSPKNHRSR